MTEQTKTLTEKQNKLCKVINLFGGPGVGKSTMAAGLYYKMKKKGYSVELVREVAKDYVYKGLNPSDFQYAITYEQIQRQRIPARTVEYIITDSPLLLSCIYSPAMGFFTNVISEYDEYENINFFLENIHEFDQEGRVHDEFESVCIHANVLAYLLDNSIPFKQVSTTKEILYAIEKR